MATAETTPLHTRRQVIAAAVAIGAVPAFASASRMSRVAWRHEQALYPQGVASGDPTPDGVILWTRREPRPLEAECTLRLELAEDEGFTRVVVRRLVRLTARTDWTCRVLVGGLHPSRTYWFRFTDPSGAGSRIGRTRTAPRDSDPRTARFAFVSCQNVTMGPLTAWRRMLHDDRAASAEERLDFVLHLGDFVYDTVWYSADRPGGYLDRALNDAVRLPDGEKHDDYHVPTSLEDYRTLYRTYLENPDLQEARARWPFVAIWDNGEFSDKGWQGLQRFGSTTRPAQTRKVYSNQAWFEYMPARVRTSDGSLDHFAAPPVRDAPVTEFDADGLGREENNLAALSSLTGYRAQRWGRNVELMLTDQRSYRSSDFSSEPGARTISSKAFPQMVPFETLEAIDAGRTANAGRPSETLVFADGVVPNFQRSAAPRTLLGREQKAWFLERMRRSTATWKVWGNTVATFDMRADPQHLPVGLTSPWPGEGYAGYPRTDYSTAYAERGEICDFVERNAVTGFVTLSGDRHSFWAGHTAKSLPPEAYVPVGLNFVTGSINTPGMVEAFEHMLAKDHPLRALYLIDRPGRAKPEAAVNLLLRHGVRTCLDYAEHGDLERAKSSRDPGNAPHVEFVDMGGHGYGLVHAGQSRLDVTFVCVPRPVAASAPPDGGPVRYRIRFSARPWKAGAAPVLERIALDGDAELSG